MRIYQQSYKNESTGLLENIRRVMRIDPQGYEN